MRYVVQKYGKRFRVWDCRSFRQIGKLLASKKTAESRAGKLNDEDTAGLR